MTRTLRILRLLLLLQAILLAVILFTKAASADAGLKVVVPAHDIARGQTIAESDLTYAQVAGNGLMSGTVTSFDAVKGMEARRLLRAGETIRPDDVRRPVVVAKGQTVTMTFEAPGVQLTAMGRAMSEGGIGDTVTIQNPASFRMITAIVTAAGTVRAAGPVNAQPQVASLNRFTPH
jgi:flagella basal body P-ring formation protein FlgA